MTKKQKQEFIDRIQAKLNKVNRGGFGPGNEAERIFKVTKAFHSKVIVGTQKRKHSADEMDEQYRKSFSAIITAIKE